MRTLVVGDIHGAYKALIQVLERAKVTPQDHIIFLGDYADGWSETPKVFDFLISFEKTHKATFIKGNHDDLCYQFLQGKAMDSKWFVHGGKATLKAYENISKSTQQAHLEFISTMKTFVLDSQNRLFIHAGFTNLRGIEHEYFQESFFWDRTLWETALAVPSSLPKTDIFYPKRLALYNEIFIGHTPTTRYGQTTPMNRHNVWNVDTGAAFTGCITIMDIKTKFFWQSDIVQTLYHNEQGRNV